MHIDVDSEQASRQREDLRTVDGSRHRLRIILVSTKQMLLLTFAGDVAEWL